MQVSLGGFLLHAWRLRRIRWAMRTLNRRLDAYERAYRKTPDALGDDKAHR